jgi:suppressor of fused-like protein
VDQADAIDVVTARLEAMYPGLEPLHWSTVYRWSEGSDAALDGISIYRLESPPHWHYVSYGMSTWGFEFSFRVARGAETEPPQWPGPLLQQLGRYVYNTGEPFGPEHYVPWGGPITNVEPTALVAMVFAVDPVLGTVSVGGDPLTFLSPIGITQSEYEVCAQDRPEDVLADLLAGNPLGVIDLRRGSSTY